MAKLVVEEVKEFGVLPEDARVGVRVESITEKDVPARNGNEGWTKLEFKFVFEDLPDVFMQEPEYAELIGTRVWGSVTKKLNQHPDNKLRLWAEALLNMGELGVGFELDTDMLIGRYAKGVIGHYTRKDGQGGVKMQIMGLLPPSTPSFAPSATAAAAAPTPPPPTPYQQALAPMASTAPARATDPWDEPPF